MYEITLVDNGYTYRATHAQCVERFGEEEFEEMRLGYLPHIIVVELRED